MPPLEIFSHTPWQLQYRCPVQFGSPSPHSRMHVPDTPLPVQNEPTGHWLSALHETLLASLLAIAGSRGGVHVSKLPGWIPSAFWLPLAPPPKKSFHIPLQPKRLLAMMRTSTRGRRLRFMERSLLFPAVSSSLLRIGFALAGGMVFSKNRGLHGPLGL
jgi:hypothetical protein